MPYRLDDTIAAVASAPGGAARGILRLSGANVRQTVAAVFRPDEPIEWSSLARPTALDGSLRLEAAGRWLPCQLYFWPTGRSFTGEPAAEIHMLGSPPLVEAALHALAAAGARPAERGEFTLRAFLNGRLDLTQAEAVLGAVDAADPDEFDVALGQLAGGLAGPLGNLRESLVDLLTHLEAGLDFADEDLPFLSADELNDKLDAASRTVTDMARRMEVRHAPGDQIRVVLSGWPNTGKSSLFNALVGRTAALVSNRPATTRDYLTAKIDLGGVKCTLVDTAGVELAGTTPLETCPSIRQSAQAASARQTRSADVEVFCLDCTQPLNLWEQSQLAREVPRRVVVLTKIDVVEMDREGYGRSAVATSSVTGQGLDTLRDRLRGAVLTAGASGGDVVAATVVRCRQSLGRAAESLGRAREIAGGCEELVAAELRTALTELGHVVGAVYSDDILERIFSRFCIGK